MDLREIEGLFLCLISWKNHVGVLLLNVVFYSIILTNPNIRKRGDSTSSNSCTSVYSYGFNGQEQDNEWHSGSVAFEFRVYDSRIGKFLSLDPLKHDFPWNSPYVFAENRVIDGVDLRGLNWRRANQEETNSYNENGNSVAEGERGYMYKANDGNVYFYEGKTMYEDVVTGAITENPTTTTPYHGSTVNNKQVTFDSFAVGCENCETQRDPGYQAPGPIRSTGTLEILNEDGSITKLHGNEFGMIKFPSSGPGFARYTMSNGVSNGNNENYKVTSNVHPGGKVMHGDSYVSPTTGAAFYNTIQEFRREYPNVTIHYGDISAYDPSINLGHRTHFTGESIDIHYFGSSGQEYRGERAYLSGSVKATNAFFKAAQNNGFTKNYTYGGRFTHKGSNWHGVHKNHLHIGR